MSARIYADGRIYGATLAERIQRHVVIDENGCWIWQRLLDQNGYPKIKVAGRSEWAHRTSYALANGGIPDGMTVDHLCFVPACVNPNHLQLASNSENAARQRKALADHCKRGHEFTPENTAVVKNRHPFGGDTQRLCRECRRQSDRARRAASRAAA